MSIILLYYLCKIQKREVFMEFTTLNNGVKMPLIGLGTFMMSPADAEEATYNALKLGYRYTSNVLLIAGSFSFIVFICSFINCIKAIIKIFILSYFLIYFIVYLISIFAFILSYINYFYFYSIFFISSLLFYS